MKIRDTWNIPLHDHNGNLTALLDTTGKLKHIYRYTAFGEETLLDAQGGHPTRISPWRFSSKRKQGTLIHFGRRDYDPATGRWITADPLGYQDGANLYTYVHNNPLTHIDPDGLLSTRSADNLKYTLNCLLQIGIELLRAYQLGQEYYETTQNEIQHIRTQNEQFARGLKDSFTKDYADLQLTQLAQEKLVLKDPSEDINNARMAGETLGTLTQFLPIMKVARYARTAYSASRQIYETLPPPPLIRRGGLGPVNKGKLGVEKSRRLIESRGHKVVGEEVTIDVIGTRRRTTRIDLIAEEPSRARYLVEGKNGLGARLNPNQREAFPILSREGGYPRGFRAKEASYERGEIANFDRLEVHHWEGDKVNIRYE
ncbi:MAG: hypothetical protein Tsb0021_04920 [Chlamydiales bacterium]